MELIGGRYRTEEKLGAGGMGTVYAATDTVTGARVALKVVAAQVAENEVLLSRFEREVRTVRALETPHVVRVFDGGRDPHSQLPYFVMEVLDGDDVGRVIKRLRPVRPDLALRIGVQACMGLEVAHAARVVHRDIKPSNLFLGKTSVAGERIVKILDFGIAKLVPEPGESGQSGDVTSLTETGSMLGSPLYMAPEQARGHKNIDHRADIWSLGVVLYQALTGRTPHPFTDALGELIIAICTEPAERIERLAPWVPKHVADVVHRALAIPLTDRYQTMSDMRAALLSCLSHGTAIHENMLVPMTDVERAVAPMVAETNVGVRDDGRDLGSRTISDQPTAHWAGANTGANTPGPMQLGPVTSTGVAGFGATTHVAERPRTGLLVAAVLAFAAMGGIGAFALLGGASKEPDKPASASPGNSVVAAMRVVRVFVEPANAQVSVDGRTVTPTDSAITIEGSLGSTHAVRVSANGQTESKDVILTERGPVPERIVVAAPQPSFVAAPVPAPAGKKGPLPRASETKKQPPPPGDIFMGR